LKLPLQHRVHTSYLVRLAVLNEYSSSFDGDQWADVPSDLIIGWCVEMAKSPKIPPRPIEKPQVVPPIRKPEVEKKHIKQSGKK